MTLFPKHKDKLLMNSWVNYNFPLILERYSSLHIIAILDFTISDKLMYTFNQKVVMILTSSYHHSSDANHNLLITTR